MNTDAWDRLETLVEQALALEPQARQAFLEQACGRDPALRAEVEALLAYADEAPLVLHGLARQAGHLFEELAGHAPEEHAPRLAREQEAALPQQARSRLDDAAPFSPKAPTAPVSLAGTRLSHYRILQRLGGGGMGVVYRAEDTRLRRTVALKFLPPQLTTDAQARERLVQEARAASALDHPNVCTLHEIGETQAGQLYLVMPFYEGETLKKKIQRGPLAVEEALAYAAQVAEGLAAAHAAGIVHRDVKPANVMVMAASAGRGTPGRVKLVDFGIAKVVGQELTQTGVLMGTVSYMSPEQARGEAVDARTDLWSLGVVLYEMLTAEKPFRGEHEQAVLYAIVHEAPEPVRVLRPEVPECVGQVVEKLLRKDPSERYQCAEEVLADLHGIREQRAPTAPHTASGSRRQRSLMRSVAAVVLLLAVGFGFYLLQAGWRPEAATSSSSPGARTMIVVLPLENLGPADQAYFAAGMTEEITSRLAAVSALGVIARSSARPYAGSDKPLQQIGEELGIDYVLEGSVRWAEAASGAGRVRITPHLSRVSDGTEIWSQTYEREMADVFAIQAEIAEAVVEQLGVRLLAREQEAIEERPTENLEAYHAYLQGQYYAWETLDFWRVEVWEQATRHFQQAVDLDPDFALAYAGLAFSHGNLIHFGYDVSQERHRKAREALDRALALAPEAPQVQRVLGEYHYFVHRDYEQALAAFEIAEQGMPGDAELLVIKGLVQRRQGRWDEALQTLEAALRLNPQDPRVSSILAQVLYSVRRYREAMQYYDRTIALAPDEKPGYLGKAWTYWTWRGDVKAARAVLEAMPAAGSTQRGIEAWFWQELYEGHYRAALGRLSALDTVLDPDGPPKPLLEARVYDLLGEPEQARRAYEAARVLLEQELDGHPQDYRRYPWLRSALGVAYAGLGRREEAIREGEAAVAFLPVSRDAAEGAYLLQELALIYAMVGEQEAALEQIETLLSMPSWLSVPLLQLDPRWAPLRSLPRFQALLRNVGRDE